MASHGENGGPSETAVREATAWFVRLNSPLASDHDRRAYREWIEADPSHGEAMTEVRTLWDDLDAPAAALASEDRRRSSTVEPARRSGARLAAGAAFLAVACCAAALWRDPGLVERVLADHATRPGQHLEARLRDGSTVVLDGDSAIRETSNEDGRDVSVTRGRVWFDVAHDAARPFRVHAGAIDVSVIGTAFAVDLSSGTVTVERGQVGVTARQGGEARLGGGERVRLGPSGLEAAARIEPATASAWRRGLIVLDAATVGEAIDELARAAPGRVLASDAAVRAMRLSGVFRADDPDAVLGAMRASLGLKTVSLPGVATYVYR